MRRSSAAAPVALAALVLASCSSGDSSPARFHVRGSVTGLAGAGLVLHSSLGDDLPISADGPFEFPTAADDGTAFQVTVKTQPTLPTQTCAVDGGSATLAGADALVAVTCATNTYPVGGTVSGLSGSGLVLMNAGTDDLSVSANGTFTFPTVVASGAPFDVMVKAQPSSPSQRCLVSGGSGTIGSAAVTSVAVSCATDAFSVGGSVTGLAGSGLVLRNGGGDDLAVTSNGTFAFATPVPSGDPYGVTVAQQPTSPSQTCAVSQGAGSVANGPVADVAITCTTNTYLVGGTVTGLAGSGLVLRQGGGDDLPVAADGPFAFATRVPSGGGFSVTVRDQPGNPWQTCVVSGGQGTVGAGDVASVTVNCATNTYAVGGAVQGLVGSGLVLRQSGGDDLAVSANGTFAFPTPVASGAAFDVTVGAQPASPWQTCAVASGSGVVASGPVSTVLVTCATNSYALGGTVAGLAGSGLVVANGEDAVAVAADGAFSLSPVASGATYTVEVRTQPTSPWQTCSVTNGSGTVAGAAVGDVAVLCTTNAYAVGGTVTGLLGTGLVLAQDGGDELPVLADGSFWFTTPVASGTGYAVTVASQPGSPSQTCVVSGEAGTIGGGPVSSVAVNCTTNTYAVGGTVSGLAGSGLVLLNGGEELGLTANGGYAFATPVASGGAYDVAVKTQPTAPWQTCEVLGGQGTVGSEPITTADVVCATNTYAVRAAVSGLAGSGLVLQQGGADDLAVAADGTYAFQTEVASGAAYAVSVASHPTLPWQTCAPGAGTGTMGGADATVAVTCTTNAYTVGGDAAGVLASGLSLRNSGGDPLAIDANGPFTFPAPAPSGAAYAVTIDSEPPTQSCSLSGAGGTVAGADVTDVEVACACSTGLANCDGIAANGCESSLASLEHCGACGVTCSAPGAACEAGACSLTGSGTAADPYVSAVPLASCREYATTSPGIVSGYYAVSGSAGPVAYCDQASDGGGWTRCLRLDNGPAEDLTGNTWFDRCVDHSNAAWSTGAVRIVLRDQSGSVVYASAGPKGATWTYDNITSTIEPSQQFYSYSHQRLVTLATGDKLMIAGRSSSNGGCGGSMGNGYGITLYPSAPNYYSNPKLFVMPYRQVIGGAYPRGFVGWSSAGEISWGNGNSFDSCASTPPFAGSFEFYIR